MQMLFQSEQESKTIQEFSFRYFFFKVKTDNDSQKQIKCFRNFLVCYCHVNVSQYKNQCDFVHEELLPDMNLVFVEFFFEEPFDEVSDCFHTNKIVQFFFLLVQLFLDSAGPCQPL